MKNLTIRSILAVLCLLFLALLVLMPFKAFAADNNLTVTPPTTYVDNTPLPAAQIAGYEVSCVTFTPIGGSSAACPSGAPVTLYTAVTGVYTLSIPATGGKVCLQARTKLVSGIFGPYKPALNCKDFPAVQPNAPDVTVAVVMGVNFSPVFGVDTRATRLPDYLGFVPVGVQCGGTVVYSYRGYGYEYVPQASVKWAKDAAPTKWALAACRPPSA